MKATLVVAAVLAAAAVGSQAAKPAKPSSDAPRATAQQTAADAAKPARVADARRAETRDWSKVDTNNDGLVSPEEMEAYLQANPGPLRK